MKIAIIGGGAAGLTAAIVASRNNASVTIFERNDRVGKKILSTGNGKCNLSNMEMSGDFYFCEDSEFVKDKLNRFGLQDTFFFFNGLGLLLMEKRGGIYPNSEQASSVLDALRYECDSLGIKTECNSYIKDIELKQKGDRFLFVLKNDQGDKIGGFDKVILCCGGKAAPKTGSDGTGHYLAKKLGHNIIDPIPALTSLCCEGDFWKAISGVRCQAGISLFDNDGYVDYCEGELQLTEYGLSGIPIFQLSRIAGRLLQEKKKVKAQIDFLPSVSDLDFRSELLSRALLLPDRNALVLLGGFFNKKLCPIFLKFAGISTSDFITDSNVDQLINVIKHFRAKVNKLNGFEQAQTTAGGVDIFEIDSNMQSKIVKGLYFAGEIVDVDGLCGGYNLQWAWSTGTIAGEAAALC